MLTRSLFDALESDESRVDDRSALQVQHGLGSDSASSVFSVLKEVPGAYAGISELACMTLPVVSLGAHLGTREIVSAGSSKKKGHGVQDMQKSIVVSSESMACLNVSIPFCQDIPSYQTVVNC